MNSLRPQGFRKSIVINGSARLVHSVLGFFLFVFIAKWFGADSWTDGFLVTNALLGILLVTGESILGISFIPIYIEIRDQQGPEKAREFANSLFSFSMVSFAGLSVLVFLLAPAIAIALAPGFSPEARIVTVNLIRISSPLIVLIGGTGLSASIFYAHQNFTAPAITSVLLVLGQVLSLVLFGREIGIYSVQIGALAGAVAQVIVLMWLLETKGYGIRFAWHPRHSGIGRVIGLLIPRFVGMATTRGNVIVDRFFASTLEVGFVSALGYAQRVIQVPSMLVMEAVAKALIPVLSKHGSAGETVQITEKLSKVFYWLNALLIPLMVMLFILRDPIIRILYERGAFGAVQTHLTANALLCYNFGLVAYSYNLVLNAAYYSIQDSSTPMKLGLLALILNFLLDMLFIKIMGMEGIALVTSIVAFIRLGLSVLMLRAKVGDIPYRSLAQSILKFSLAAAPMGAVVWFVVGHTGKLLNTVTLTGSLFQVATASAVGGFVYLSMCYAMNIHESHRIVQMFGRKLPI